MTFSVAGTWIYEGDQGQVFEQYHQASTWSSNPTTTQRSISKYIFQSSTNTTTNLLKAFNSPFIASLLAANPLLGKRDALCNNPGIRGAVPATTAGGPVPYLTITGKGQLDAYRRLCYSKENAKCRSFAIRENASSGGACQLFDFNISPQVIPRDTSTYTYFPLPEGIQGWVPENFAKHYSTTNTKAAGNYAACRQLCLNDAGKCRGFGS